MAVITSRLVPDPSMSDAEYYAQRSANPSKPNLGRVLVQENAMTRMGGLCLIRRRLNHHEKAAEWFKNAYEQLYGGISPAIDMAKVRVDTSIMAHDNGAVARLDRGKDLQHVMDTLGKSSADRIIACVVLGIPCGDGSGWRERYRSVDGLLDALDHVAKIKGWVSKRRAA